MKKFILSLLLIGLMIIPTFAITVEELDTAEEILTQMDAKISVLRECVQLASQGKIREIILTSEQRVGLQQKYLDGKEELKQLFLQLP